MRFSAIFPLVLVVPAILSTSSSKVEAVDGSELALKISYYHEEESGRQVKVRETDAASVEVEIRFPGEPGYFSRWMGKGTRTGNEIVFTRNIGAEEDPGAKFTAKLGSRLEIEFAPDQVEPADEGFQGEYRRISEERHLSLAVRESKSAEEALEKVQRQWGGSKDANLVEWRRRWPDLRRRWMGRNPVNPAPDETTPGASADHWLAVVESTGMAIAFFNPPVPEMPVPPDGSGDYDDGFGGRVSVRARADGSYRLGFGWQRGDLEAMGSEFSFDLPAAEVKRARGGDDWTADFVHADASVPAGEPRARFRLHKSGRYLWVEATDATRYVGRAWIDGIYRWGPIPVAE